jgi:hypothetical protein
MKTRSVAHSARIGLETLESRTTPAKVLDPSNLIYQDRDGDSVVVRFSKPILNVGDPNVIFTFDSGAGAVNGTTAARERLIRIDLTSISTAAAGVSITTRATPTVTGGDGFASISQINAATIDLGRVTIDGDLAGVRALSLKSLTAQSLRPNDNFISTVIPGNLGSISVKGDVGTYIQVNGHVNSMRIGGSLIGSTSQTGMILVSDGIDLLQIGGNIEGASASDTGEIRVFRHSPAKPAIGSLTVGGDLIGGSQQGSGDLIDSSIIRASGIKSLTIGGSIIAGLDSTTGPFVGSGAIISDNSIGTITVRGSLIGNSTNPVIITAAGGQSEEDGKDVAIGLLSVKGRVGHALIEAGGSTLTGSIDADAQIGSIRVGGDWIASSAAAGATPGPSGFGTFADVKMSGTGVRDDATISSSIGSVSIAGQIRGTMGGTDHFGFVAEQIGKVTVGGTAIPLLAGKRNDDVLIGITGDFDVRELR